MAGFRLPLVTVEPFMFLCMKAFFLNIVALPQIFLRNVCLRKHNESKCSAMFAGLYKEEYDMVQEESTLWFGGYIIIATFITILVLPFVASLSDEIGRHKAMILYPVGQIILDVIILCILSTGTEFPTWILMVMGAIPGLVGDVSGLYVLASAYIVDITTEKGRTLRINLLEASSMLAGFSATITSGYIIERFGFCGIYVINLSLLVLAILYLVFFIKPVQKKRNLDNGCKLGEESGGNYLRTNQRNSYLMMEKNSLKKKEAVGLEGASNNKLSKGTSEEFYDDDGFHSDEKIRLTTSSAADEEKSAKSNAETQLIGIVLNADDNNKPSGRGVNEIGAIDFGAKKDDIDEIRNETLVELDEMNNTKERSCTKCTSNTIIFIFKISNPISNFKKVIQILRDNGNMCYGLTLFLLVSLVSISYSGEMAVIVFYITNHPYYFGSREIGLFLAFESALLAIVGLVVFNYLFTKILKMNDHKLLAVTSAAYVVYYVLLGFSDSKLMLYLIQIIHAVAALNLSTLRATLSKAVPRSSSAVIFSALLMIETGSILIAAVISPIAYAKTAALHPGTVFFVLAIIMFLSCCVSFPLLFANCTYKHFITSKE